MMMMMVVMVVVVVMMMLMMAILAATITTTITTAFFFLSIIVVLFLIITTAHEAMTNAKHHIHQSAQMPQHHQFWTSCINSLLAVNGKNRSREDLVSKHCVNVTSL